MPLVAALRRYEILLFPETLEEGGLNASQWNPTGSTVTQKWAPGGAQGALPHFEPPRTDITLKPNSPPPRRNTIQRSYSDPTHQGDLIQPIPKPLGLVHQRPTRELKKKPKPPMRLHLQDCGEGVLACLQGIEGLQQGDGNSLVATRKLNKEEAGSIAKAIGLLLKAQPANVKTACELVLLCGPTARFALVEFCQPEWMELLVRSDPEVGRAMERAFKDAAGEAIHAKEYRQFFELVSGCDAAAASNLSKILPALTEEMVQGLDSDVFIKAMHMTLKSAQERHLYDCLNQLHSLLSIAGNLEEKNPGRALAMKCLIWPVLDNLYGIVDCRREVKELQRMALLPELSAELLGGLPGSLQGELLCVKVDQIMNWPGNEQKVDGLLRLAAALYPQIDRELAYGLQSVIYEALEQLPDDQRPDAEARTQLALPETSEIQQVGFRREDFEEAMVKGDLLAAARVIRDSRGLSRANGARDLFKAVSDKLKDVGIDIQKHTTTRAVDEEAARKRISVVREMAVILLRTGEPYGVEIAATILGLVEPGPERFIQLLLREGLGIAGYSLSAQMARALPMLCDGDHSAELAVILGSDAGEDLIAQALIDHHLMEFWASNTAVSLIPTLVPRIDLRAALNRRKDSAEKTSELEQLSIQRLITGEPFHAEAARIILVQLGMWSEKEALALLNAELEGKYTHPSDLTLAVFGLCIVKPSEFDVLLEKEEGRRLIAHIAMDCLEDSDPSDATVALLWGALAHRLRLREWVKNPARIMKVAMRMATVELGDQVVQGFHKWAPGWRSLVLIKLDPRFRNPEWLAAAVLAENLLPVLPRLRALKPSEIHEFHNAMMSVRLPGTDTPLFPVDAINNITRAFMLEPTLIDPKWLLALPDEQRMNWWKAMVFFFNSFSDQDGWDFRFERAALLQRLGQVQDVLGAAALAEIKGYFHLT
jgi:hypothetical protein